MQSIFQKYQTCKSEDIVEILVEVVDESQLSFFYLINY